MNLGNSKKVMADAKKIARRLRETKCTLRQLTIEYHCGYNLMIRVIRLQIQQEEWLQIRKKKLAQGGVKTRFQKGHIPPNKGIKGVHYSPATEFEKGHLPTNHKELGTITVHRSKRDRPFQMIAIAGSTPTRHKWIPYARYLWEKGNGRSVPEGFFVVHADGNRLHDDPDNLILTNCKGNMELMRKNNPNLGKKISKGLKKSWRIRRMKKNQALRKVQREAEQLQKCQARLLRVTDLETEQKKMVEEHMLEIYGLQVCIWECSGCAAEYEGENPPANCIHCGSSSFEKNFYRRKTG